MAREVDLILIKDGKIYNIAAFDVDGYMPSATQPDPTWGYYVELTQELVQDVVTKAGASPGIGWLAMQGADGSWSFEPPAALT